MHQGGGLQEEAAVHRDRKPEGKGYEKRQEWRGRQAKGYYTNRRGFSIPVLVWAEDGTKPRYTRRTAGNRGGWLSGLDPMSGKRLRSKSSKGAYRGKMPAMGFMARTKVEAAPQVTDGLHEAVRAYTVKTAKKYGCKIT